MTELRDGNATKGDRCGVGLDYDRLVEYNGLRLVNYQWQYCTRVPHGVMSPRNCRRHVLSIARPPRCLDRFLFPIRLEPRPNTTALTHANISHFPCAKSRSCHCPQRIAPDEKIIPPPLQPSPTRFTVNFRSKFSPSAFSPLQLAWAGTPLLLALLACFCTASHTM